MELLEQIEHVQQHFEVPSLGGNLKNWNIANANFITSEDLKNFWRSVGISDIHVNR